MHVLHLNASILSLMFSENNLIVVLVTVAIFLVLIKLAKLLVLGWCGLFQALADVIRRQRLTIECWDYDYAPLNSVENDDFLGR